MIEDVIKVLTFLFFGFVAYFLWPTNSNLDYVKQHSSERWREVGFEISGYDGYNFGSGIGSYGGANVWYFLKSVPDNGITYSGYLQRWGDEIHTYRVEAIDAIKPKK